MLIVDSGDKMITFIKNMLNSRFDMKDLGLGDVRLGKIKRIPYGLILCQSHYVDNILGNFDKDNSGTARTPIDATLYFSKNKAESASQVEYSRIVIGFLMYLMSCTRPNIAYAINKLSRYMSNPRAKYWQGIMRVLKYLQFTRDYGLYYTRYHVIVEGYIDVNLKSNVKYSKSQSGYVFTL